MLTRPEPGARNSRLAASTITSARGSSETEETILVSIVSIVARYADAVNARRPACGDPHSIDATSSPGRGGARSVAPPALHVSRSVPASPESNGGVVDRWPVGDWNSGLVMSVHWFWRRHRDWKSRSVV